MNNKKKNNHISILFPFSSDGLGGSYFSASDIIENLNKDVNYKTYVVLPKKGKNYDTFSKHSEVINYQFSTKRINRLHKFRGIANKIINIDTIFYLLFKAIKIVNQNEIDIIHVNDDKTIFVWALIGRLYNIRVIWHVRQNKGNNFLDRIKLNISDFVIFNSYSSSNRFPNIKKPNRIIYNGFKINHSKQVNISDYNNNIVRIGYLSNFTFGKGLEIYLETAQELSKMYDNISFVVGGEDLTVGRYQKMIDEFIYKNPNINFEYRGFVFNTKFFYDSIDIFYTPSSIESFGRVFVEAALNKLPLVGCNLGGLKEIISDNQNGFLIDCNCIDDIIKKLSYLIDNPNLRLLFGNNAYALAQNKFNFKKSIKEIKKIYKSLKEE